MLIIDSLRDIKKESAVELLIEFYSFLDNKDLFLKLLFKQLCNYLVKNL